jgi:hypothetical protein
MGVQGLWQLLEASGRSVSLESLQGKVLAVGNIINDFHTSAFTKYIDIIVIYLLNTITICLQTLVCGSISSCTALSAVMVLPCTMVI